MQACADIAEANDEAHTDEHALEVKMPIVRALFPDVPTVPIMVPPQASPVELGRRLAALVGPRRASVLASTDLTHYGEPFGFTPAGTGPDAHDWMVRNDRRFLDRVAVLAAEDIVPEASQHRNACGSGAVAAAVAFARARGATEGTVIERTDSHEVDGNEHEFTHAVGYAGVII